MRRFPLVLVGAAGLIAVTLGLASPAQAAPTTFTTRLRASNESPPTASSGAGGALVTVDAATNQVCLDATNVANLGPVTGSHIHKQVAGQNGPVVINFGGSLDTCVAASATTVGEILADPTGFYVNLHTAAYPGGAIRGQLAAPAYTRLQTTVSGTSEVPPTTSTATGLVTVDLDPSSGQVCVDASAVSIGTIEGHHIHQGPVGADGPVVVDFNAQKVTCVFANPDVVAGIIGNPGGFYTNMHTDQFPGGEVRGQLAAQQTTTTTSSTTTSTSTSTTSTTVASTTSTTIDRNCSDFTFQEDAQAVLDQNPSDPYGLDGPVGTATDGIPGKACESLPSRVSAISAQPNLAG